MIPADLHFAFPEGLYLFPFSIVLTALLWKLIHYRSHMIQKYFSKNVLDSIYEPRSLIHSLGKVVAYFLFWIFAMFALMQPEGNGRYALEGQKAAAGKREGGENVKVQRKAHDVIFLVDASASMSVKDTRTGVTRLEYAKDIVDQIISRLRGESVALYAFTSDTTQLSPLTMDYLFVRLVLRSMKINEGGLAGTDLVEALSNMRDAYFSKVLPKLTTLVLITDGGDTELEELHGEARKLQMQQILSLIPNPKEHRLRIFTIGVGTEQGKPIPGMEQNGKPVISGLDEELLKKLSQKGRGRFYFANHWTSPELAKDIIQKMNKDQAPLESFTMSRSSELVKGGDDLVYDHFFQYPLGVAIFLLIWILFFPESRVRQ